ncbi:hypothetical protein Y447_07220 [Listeria monocytogenes]|nr:hypothetical protein [Listeria monocytogenes]EAC6780070.1 hypothetical protein [Listeria monocytogenes]
MKTLIFSLFKCIIEGQRCKKKTTGYRGMTDELREQRDYIIFEQELSSGLVKIKGKNIIVINIDLSQNEKLEDIARLLNKI